jgi:Bacterial PH domain
MPDEPYRPDESLWSGDSGWSAEPVSPPPTPEPVVFRVDARLAAAKVAGAVIFLLLAVVFRGDPGRTAFATLGGAVLAGYALRDLIAPRRLAADAEGVTVVVGFAGHRRLGWSEIERVRVDERRRLGTRSELLEIDTGETLHLFSGYDLGVPVWKAARVLAALAPPGLTSLPDPG